MEESELGRAPCLQQRAILEHASFLCSLKARFKAAILCFYSLLPCKFKDELITVYVEQYTFLLNTA